MGRISIQPELAEFAHNSQIVDLLVKITSDPTTGLLVDNPETRFSMWLTGSTTKPKGSGDGEDFMYLSVLLESKDANILWKESYRVDKLDQTTFNGFLELFAMRVLGSCFVRLGESYG